MISGELLVGCFGSSKWGMIDSPDHVICAPFNSRLQFRGALLFSALLLLDNFKIAAVIATCSDINCPLSRGSSFSKPGSTVFEDVAIQY